MKYEIEQKIEFCVEAENQESALKEANAWFKDIVLDTFARDEDYLSPACDVQVIRVKG